MIKIETVIRGSFENRYFRFGRGDRTMVIIPGLSVKSVMESADIVAKQYKVFDEDFTTYVFDRRKNISSPYSIKELADDAATLTDILGLKDICLFGTSHGGMISLQLCHTRADLVKKLALGSTSINVSEDNSPALEKWIAKAKSGDAEGLMTDMGRDIYPDYYFNRYEEAFRQLGKTITEEELRRFIIQAETIKGFDFTDRVRDITCPVFAVGSSDDKVLGKTAITEIKKAFSSNPGFSCHIYEGFGHAAYDMAPDFTERLFTFFK